MSYKINFDQMSKRKISVEDKFADDFKVASFSAPQTLKRFKSFETTKTKMRKIHTFINTYLQKLS